MIAAALAALTIAVYAPVRHHGFVSIDDPAYVTENPMVSRGLTVDGVVWALTTGHASNWHPLTWLSHMLDVQWFGMSAGAHHLTSLALHVLATLLLFLLLRTTTGRAGPSAVVAALFAVHPLHVESVAWVAERKDVLSAVFFFATTLAYVSSVRAATPGGGAEPAGEARMRPAAWLSCALTLALYALGLMSKPMLVTMPLVLLLLDMWPLGRAPWPDGGAGGQPRPAGRRTRRALVVEKLPLFVLAGASGVITFIVQRSGGAVSALDTVSFGRRVANALVSYGAYAAKAVWPSGLSPFYPYPDHVPTLELAASAAFLAGASVLAARWGRARPYLLVGWLWYLVTLLPVIGIVQIGRQAMADRYTYLPLVGLFIAVTWGVCDLATKWPARRIVLPALAATAIALAAAAAHAQVAVWADSATLWRHALATDPRNYFALHSLGCLDSDAGRTDEAARAFEETIRLAPDYPEARNNLGLMRARQGRIDEAIRQYRAALALDPSLADAHNNLGFALAAQHRTQEAIAEYREAIRLKPDAARFHHNLGKALASQGNVDDAVVSYGQALRLDPRLPDVRNNLGVALMARGAPAEAVAQYREELRLQPARAEVHSNLGVALATLGRREEAIREFNEALRLQPDLAQAHTGLALELAGTGRLADALPHFAEAARLQPASDAAHQYLGLALAGAGRFDEAIVELSEALRLNPANTAASQALAAARTRR